MPTGVNTFGAAAEGAVRVRGRCDAIARSSSHSRHGLGGGSVHRPNACNCPCSGLDEAAVPPVPPRAEIAPKPVSSDQTITRLLPPAVASAATSLGHTVRRVLMSALLLRSLPITPCRRRPHPRRLRWPRHRPTRR
jgi:hypothetical protein